MLLIARPTTAASMAPANSQADALAPAAARAPPRSRGRPRKTVAERDDGNRRQGLISAAAKLFRQKGFSATSTRDIAAAVGMRSGSPFYHFESKEALLAAVMEQGMLGAIERQQAVMAAFDAARHTVDAAAQAAERLRSLVRGHFEVLLGEHSDFIPVMLFEWRSLNVAQRALVAHLQVQYELLWMPVFDVLHASGRIRGDAKLAKLLFFGALNWSVQWYSARGTASLDALTQSVLDTFLQAPRSADEASTLNPKTQPTTSSQTPAAPRNPSTAASPQPSHEPL